MVLDFSYLSHAFAYSFIEQIPTQDLQCTVTGSDFNFSRSPAMRQLGQERGGQTGDPGPNRGFGAVCYQAPSTTGRWHVQAVTGSGARGLAWDLTRKRA